MNCVDTDLKIFIRYRSLGKRFKMQFRIMDHEF